MAHRPLRPRDNQMRQLLKLINGMFEGPQEVTSRQTATGLGSVGTSTPGGGGGAGEATTRQWIFVPGADVAAPATITAADLGVDIYTAASFEITGSGSRFKVFVNGDLLNQGSSGSYARWSIASATSLTITNLDLAGPLGVYSGTTVIVREN